MKPIYKWTDSEDGARHFELYEIKLDGHRKKQYLIYWNDDELDLSQTEGVNDDVFLAVEETYNNGHTEMYRFWNDLIKEHPEYLDEDDAELIKMKTEYWKTSDIYWSKRRQKYEML
jgi:hypothetical protein